jgi:hypothetical protein
VVKQTKYSDLVRGGSFCNKAEACDVIDRPAANLADPLEVQTGPSSIGACGGGGSSLAALQR